MTIGQQKYLMEGVLPSVTEVDICPTKTTKSMRARGFKSDLIRNIAKFFIEA